MQIWKSPCMFVFKWKYCSENFSFLILRMLELFTHKVWEIFVYKQKKWNTLKSRLIFKKNTKFRGELLENP